MGLIEEWFAEWGSDDTLEPWVTAVAAEVLEALDPPPGLKLWMESNGVGLVPVDRDKFFTDSDNSVDVAPTESPKTLLQVYAADPQAFVEGYLGLDTKKNPPPPDKEVWEYKRGQRVRFKTAAVTHPSGHVVGSQVAGVGVITNVFPDAIEVINAGRPYRLLPSMGDEITLLE
jgi:hypothetical protein